MGMTDMTHLKQVNETAENVFRIAVPYGLISNPNADHNNKKKVIFWGASFMKLSEELKLKDYVTKANECLDYIRRECVGQELYYKPHPAEKEELNLLNLASFKILEDPTLAEIFLWKNSNQIRHSFSIASNASLAAHNFGLNSYVFYKLFEPVVGTATFEAWKDYFKNSMEQICINDLSRPLQENMTQLRSDELLEKNIGKLLGENKGKIWLSIVEPSPIMVMVSVAKLIKQIDPGRQIGLIISEQRRWRIIDMSDFKDYFDSITFLPRIYYSLRPKKVWQAILQSFKIKNLKINSSDLIVSFMAFPNFSFVENCLLSYFKKNKKVTFCYSINFDLMYALKFSEFFNRDRFKPKLASLFFNKILEPLLGLRKTIYLQYGDGRVFNITRYQKPLEEIFDQVYLIE